MSDAVSTPVTAEIDIEKTLAELEKIVNRLELPDMTLEASLQEYERGIRLIRQGMVTLQKAELRVQKILDRDASGEWKSESFEHQASFGEASASTAEAPPAESKPARSRVRNKETT